MEKTQLSLPPYPDYKAEKELTYSNIQGAGIVIWWNFAMGMGVITTSKGAARVHWKSITTSNGGLKYLKRKQPIFYKKLVPLKISRSTLKIEARGISVIEG